MDTIVLGVDIGGSHISSALINLTSKVEIENSWSRAKINSKGSAEDIIVAWADTMEKSMRVCAVKPKKISIAMPGPMDYRKGICKIKDQDKYNSLYNLNVKEMLAARLNLEPSKINFLNDAACFLKGEVYSGCLSGFDKAIGITLGTGLGTACFSNGNAMDANLWKMPFLNGIAEDYISTSWFIKRYDELNGVIVKDVKDLIDNHSGCALFRQVFEEFSENLANFLYKFIRKEMPFAAVIGGNIANAEAYFLEDTRAHLANLMGYSFPVKISTLGERAMLIGAGSS